MRKITEIRFKILEVTSTNHGDSICELTATLNLLLDHLGLRVETVPSRKIIKDLSKKEGKKEEEKWPQP